MLRPIALALSVLPGLAHATDITDPFSGKRPHTFDLHAGVGWYYNSFAVGGRYAVPIVDNGFIDSLNNSVTITFGADLYLAGYVEPDGDIYRAGGLGVPVTLAWNFYFTEDWSAFGEAGVNVYFSRDRVRAYGFYPGANWVITSVGGRYHLDESKALILRVGNPYAAFGIEFTL